MRILGQDNVREYGVAVVPRSDGDPLNLKIQSVGSEAERIASLPCWHAEPPATVLRDAKGAIVRDKDGQHVTVYNREAAAFKSRQAELNALYGVAYIYLGLVQEPGNVEWDTDHELLDSDPLGFFRSIRDEMESVGLSQGAQAELFRQIHELSVPSKEEVDAAKGTFQDA